MSNDSHLFKTREDLESEGWTLEGNIYVRGNDKYLPLYEAKMMQLFDHRAANIVLSSTALIRQGQPESFSNDNHRNQRLYPMPRFWVNKGDVDSTLGYYTQPYLLGVTKVTSPSNWRTCVPTLFPRSAAGDNVLLQLSDQFQKSGLYACVLISIQSSFIFDYVARQKLGGTNYNFFIQKQIPVLNPDVFQENCSWSHNETVGDWISERVIELTYTSWNMKPFAEDCRYSGPPFTWDEERRFQLRCELDAAFFHLYGIQRDDVEYIMDTFPIVKRKDEKEFGEYRTKNFILEIYDKMHHAIETGTQYQTILDPSPEAIITTNSEEQQ